jgi:hypothetical protein
MFKSIEWQSHIFRPQQVVLLSDCYSLMLPVRKVTVCFVGNNRRLISQLQMNSNVHFERSARFVVLFSRSTD